MSFVFYDTETTGTDLNFDQILQFAAILTDDNLQEIERFEIRSRLLPHVVPSPGAMSVTGVTAVQLENPNYPSHYEMVCQIHQKLCQWEPAQFVGHNSIEFDEVLLRSAFYKCLLPVFLTDSNGNTRLDSLKMLRKASVYEPGSIVYPYGSKGVPVFKLDQLAPANGFDHANAHEAMSDVEATIFMCRKVRDEAPKTWSQYMRFSDKNAVFDFCGSEQVFGLTEFYFGKPYTFLLHQIGINPENRNEIIAFDLANDPSELATCSDEILLHRMKKSPKAIRKLRANGLPGLIDGIDAHPHTKISDVSFTEIHARADQLSQSDSLTGRLVSAYMDSKSTYDKSLHVEENLYSGFPSYTDQARMTDFHNAAWKDRYNILCQFEDQRYVELGERILFAEAPGCLPDARHEFWQEHAARRKLGIGDVCRAVTLSEALQQADDLLLNLEGPKRDLLIGHKEYLSLQLETLQSYLA